MSLPTNPNDLLQTNPQSSQPALVTGTVGFAGDAKPLLEARHISKRFPGVVANDAVSLTIQAGEIQTILGENGAGKSTLMNILAGMLQPDAGQIISAGQPLTFGSPRDALLHGIGTVYQHFSLVPNLSVIENIILGTDSGFMLDLGQAERRLKDLLGDFGLAVSPRTEVGRLSIGQQQRVEIVKALFRGSRVLLLDEPTSVLTPLEVKELFAILLRLKAEGVAVVFITHKLDEALAISDRITILRQGRLAGQLGPNELSQQTQAEASRQIVELMFGGKPPTERVAQPSGHRETAPAICALDRITARGDRGSLAVRAVSLKLYAGEILGIAGVDGNGQKELGEVIAGQRPISAGRLLLEGVDITNLPNAAAGRVGIGYVTDDRLGEASVPSLSLAENLIMKVVNRPPFSRWTLLNWAAIEAQARRLIQEFNIKTPGPWARLDTLSGGNIQKLLLARELAGQPKVLICNKPTHGLDVMTAQFVWRALRAQANRGAAVLLISSELDEIMEISDRIGVMYNGQLLDVLDRAEADLETIGRLMLGWQP